MDTSAVSGGAGLLADTPACLPGVVPQMSQVNSNPPPSVIPPAIQRQSSSFAAFLLEVQDRLTLPTTLPQRQDRSMTPEEVFSYLVCFNQHESWLTSSMPFQPPPGSLFLFDRQKLAAYRKDGYVWKRKKGATVNTTRISRLTLKVFGKDIIHATYLKHDREPRFKRRDYWLNENRNIVLVHYLLERKYEILPTLTDSQWRELLDNSTQPEEQNEVDVPSYIELLKIAPDAPTSGSEPQLSEEPEVAPKDVPSEPAGTSQTDTPVPIDQKKKVVPIAPAPPSIQYSFSVIVLKGGLSLIFAYPTSGVGQVVPLACVRLGENGEEGETPTHTLPQVGSLSATVAKLLTSNQIPASEKQLLLTSLSAVVPQLNRQVEEEPGPSKRCSSLREAPAASNGWNTALPPNMATLLQSMPGFASLPGSAAHTPALQRISSTYPQTTPPSSSVSSPFSRSVGNELANLSDLLRLAKCHTSTEGGNAHTGRSPTNPAPTSVNSPTAPYSSKDYDPQAFSQFARDLSSSVADPLNPTLDSKRKQKRVAQKFGQSHSCPVSPSPATSWAANVTSTRRPSGRLPSNAVGSLAALLNPPSSYYPPNPLAHLSTLPASVALVSHVPTTKSPPPAPAATAAATSAVIPPPSSSLAQQSRSTGSQTAPVDGLAFFEEMDWATLERGLLGAADSSGQRSVRTECPTSEGSCVTPSSSLQPAVEREHIPVPVTASNELDSHYPVPANRSAGESPALLHHHSNGHLHAGEIHTPTEVGNDQALDNPAPSSEMSSAPPSMSMDYNPQAFSQFARDLSETVVDPLHLPFDNSWDSLLSTILGDTGFMSSVLEDTHPPPVRGEGQPHLGSEAATQPLDPTAESAPSQSPTHHEMDSSLTTQHNREHSMNVDGNPAHSVSPTHLGEAATAPVERILHDLFSMTSPKGDGPSVLGTFPDIASTPQHGSSGTSPMFPQMASNQHNPDAHSSFASNENGISHQQVEQTVVLSEGVSPNWSHQSALSASDMAALFSVTQDSKQLPSRMHSSPVHSLPSHPPLSTSPQPPHFINHHQQPSDQTHLHTAHPPAQLPGPGDPTSLTNGLQHCLSGPHTQAFISAGSELNNASFTIASTTPAPLLEEPCLHPTPPLLQHSQPNSNSWLFADSHMDSTQSFQLSDPSPSSSSSRQEPVSAPPVAESCVATLRTGLPAATPLKYNSPVDAMKRELVCKLKELSHNHDSLQEEFRHLEAHCTPCVHDALFEQSLVQVWRMLFSLLVERNNSNVSNTAELTPEPSSEGVSLLHIVAALGFTTCMEVLWRHSDSLAQQEEVSCELDPLSCDQDGCTPFFWACYHGNASTAVCLLQWDPQPVVLPNNDQLLPLEVAARQGHQHLVDTLCRFSTLAVGNPSICISPASDSQSQFPTQVAMATSSGAASPVSPSPTFSMAPGPSHLIPRYPTSHGPLYEQQKVEGNTPQHLLTRRETPHEQLQTEGNPPEGGDLTGSRNSLEVPLSSHPRTLSPTLPRAGSQSGMFTSSPMFSLFRAAPTSPMSPAESSSSSHSTSTLSVPGTPGIFDPTELCELLSESRSIEEHDFANMDLSDREQQELIKAARTIQTAFRKYTREQRMVRAQSEREKRAALTIENYYKRYRELKRQNQAALVIQQHYRTYKQSLAQHQREGVKRAAQVMEDFMRIRENEAARKIQNFLRQWKKKKRRMCRDQS